MIDKYNYNDVNNGRSNECLLKLLDKYEKLQKEFQKQSKLILDIEKIIISKAPYMSKVVRIYEKIRKRR